MWIKTYFGFIFFVVSIFGSCHVLAETGASPVQISKIFSKAILKNRVFLDGAIYYANTEATANPSTGNEWQFNTSIYELKLGYVFSNSLYMGGEYSARSDNQIYLTNHLGEASAIGAGYFFENGLNLRVFYRFNEYFGNYSAGRGAQIDLGYMISFGSNYFLGLNFSARQLEFNENLTLVGFKGWTRTETYPLLNLGVTFN